MAKFEDLDLLKVGHTIQLTGAVYSGEGKTFIMMFPEDQGDDNEKVELDLSLDEWKTFIRQTDLLEVEAVVKDKEGLGKAILRKSTRQIEQGVSWAVYRRDNYTCRYCGANDIPLTVDHLVLWEEGGPSIEDNLVAADRRCNKTRGNLPYAQWLEHPYYKKVSKALTEEQRVANRQLLETLPAIPRRPHQRSR